MARTARGRFFCSMRLYEAAQVDGADGYRRFAHIILPLLGEPLSCSHAAHQLWTIDDFTTGSLVSEGPSAALMITGSPIP